MNSPEPRTAATVVLIRDGSAGPEVLLLKRNQALLFAGGVWVFPGGALDPEDWEAAGCVAEQAGRQDEEAAARIAAAREAQEEAGLEVDPDTMVAVSHWTTPVAEPKRFYTWFYLALVPPGEVAIDGGEIHEYQWISIRDAVDRHEAGELAMFPPTIMTLRALLGYLSAEDALIGMAARDPYRVLPVFAASRDPVQVMFEGDAGYASGDAERAGPRHRAQLVDGCWQYVCESLPADQVRLDS